jgi:Spy/CpxP family protein refolding chaperone
MKARNIILALAAAALLAVPSAALAQTGPGPGQGGGPGWGGGPGGAAWGHGPHGDGFGDGPGDGLGFFDHMLPRLADDLGLTDEQLVEIHAILDEARPEIEGYAEQLRAGRDAYREAHPDPTVFDDGAFRAHAAAQAQIQIELMIVAQRTKAEALAVLTPDQLAQLEAMRADMGKRFYRRSGGRQPQ